MRWLVAAALMLACSTTYAETVTGYDRDGNPIEIDIDIPTPTQSLTVGGLGLPCGWNAYWSLQVVRCVPYKRTPPTVMTTDEYLHH
jgi:hypothetical protein